ncbi:MAG TPA: bifunctional 4-hydroxy-2-oxoglutarate aldolase/2-dehydro-3-deoxy-phosphogluconate aldolase [Candidatus Limnocylindrales bacterium]
MDLAMTCQEAGVLPVVTVSRPEQAIPLAEALLAGGLRCIEITFRSDAAAAAIELVHARVQNVIVGAGTVLTREQADAAIAAGAAFLVAPAFNPIVVDHALARGIPILPGIATPSELESAMSRDLRLVKVFPAGPLGGPAFVQALAGPYPTVRFVPTGGVTLDNLAEYLAVSSVAAVGGTWLAKADAIAAGRWEAIERAAADAFAVVQRLRPSAEAGPAARVGPVGVPTGGAA